MADLKPDATMTEHRCWCDHCRYDAGRWWDKERGPLGEGEIFCPHCASELHREGALAGWAGPPQEALLDRLRRFDALADEAYNWSSRVPQPGHETTKNKTAWGVRGQMIAMHLATFAREEKETPHV